MGTNLRTRGGRRNARAYSVLERYKRNVRSTDRCCARSSFRYWIPYWFDKLDSWDYSKITSRMVFKAIWSLSLLYSGLIDTAMSSQDLYQSLDSGVIGVMAKLQGGRLPCCSGLPACRSFVPRTRIHFLRLPGGSRQHPTHRLLCILHRSEGLMCS